MGCTLALAVVAAPAHAAPALEAPALYMNGTVSGTLVNGTHNNAIVAGQDIALQAIQGAKAQDVAKATSDGQGHFSFTGLDTSGDTTYAVYARYQGGLFPSGAITFDNGTTQTITLTLYDVTHSDGAISVSVATLLFSAPNAPKGLLPVGEFYTFKNSGNTAYIATPDAANGKPMNLLRFSLPDGATNLTLGAGFDEAQVAQVGTGFGATATLPPGETQFAFAFDAPYRGTQYQIHYKVEYPTAKMVVLIPTDMHANGQDFAAQPQVSASGKQYQLFTKSDVAPATQLGLRLRDLPLPGLQPDLDFGQLVVVVGGLALLLALLLFLYLRRGRLAVVLGLVPASTFAASKRAIPAEREREATRKRLLKTLLRLERQHEAGTLGDADYAHKRAETRAALRAILAHWAEARLQKPGAEAPATQNEAGAEQTASDSEAVAPTGAETATNTRHSLSGGHR
jgi:hypothetical protein